MRSYLIITMCLLFLALYFSSWYWLEPLVALLICMAFVSSAMKADRLPRIIGIFMLGFGLYLELGKGTGFEGVTGGLFMTLPLICLFTFAPLIAIPLRVSGYFEAVNALLNKFINHPTKLFAGISGTFFLLSPVLNLGSMKVIHEFLEPMKMPPPLIAKSYLVGFVGSILWSPFFSSVSFTLFFMGLQVGEYFIYGFSLALFFLIIGNILFVLWVRKHPWPSREALAEPLSKHERHHLAKLGLFVAGLMAITLTIEYLTHWSILIIVSLISLTLPMVWGIVFRVWKQFIPHLKSYRDQTVPLMNNEITLFTGAGMFGYAIQGTSFAEGLNLFLTELSHVSFWGFAIVFFIIVISITFIGFHQLAVIIPFAMILKPEDLGMSPLSLALLIMVVWSVSTALSPFTGMNLLLSRYTGYTGLRVGLISNGIYCFIVALIGITVVAFLR